MLVTILIAVLAFVTLAGVGFVFAGGDPNAAKTAKRAQALTGQRTPERVKRVSAADPTARRKQILNTLKAQEKQQRKMSLSIGSRIQQAGLSISETQFWIFSGVFGAVVMAAAAILTQKPLIALGVGFAAGLGLPRWLLGVMAGMRTKKFIASFSDAMDVIVRGIKSGLPVNDCLKVIAKESPQPLAGEFQRLVENLAVGLSMDQALERMYERMPTSELRFFTIVLAIQQKTGGNLAEALGNLSAVIRARKMMREKIKAMSSEALASAVIIASLPPGVVILISLTAPTYMTPLFTDQRGHLMLLFSAVWMSMGVFVMRKMINFKF